MGKQKPTAMGTQWDKFSQRLAWVGKLRKIRVKSDKKEDSSNVTPSQPEITSFSPQWLQFEIINTVVKQAIDLEIEKQVANDWEFLQLEEEKLKLFQKEMTLKEEKRAKDKKWHDQFSFYLNLYVVVGALMMASAGVGVVLGINIPEAIACHSEHSPCWHLRLRNSKIIR